MTTSEAARSLANRFDATATISPDNRRLRYLELCLVLFFSYGSSLNTAIYILNFGPTGIHRTSISLAYSFAHAVIAVVLLRYVLSRSGRNFEDIGLRWSWKDLPIGVLLLIVALVFEGTIYFYSRNLASHFFGFIPHFMPARDVFGHLSVPLASYLLVGPVAEELIVRAYLMTEVKALTGSTTLAVLGSVVAQGSYHLYYGWFGAAIVSCQFLVFSLFYARWRRSLPTLVAHELYDIIAMSRL